MVVFVTKTIYLDTDAQAGHALRCRVERALKSDARFDGVTFDYCYIDEEDCAKFVLSGEEELLDVLSALLDEPVTDRERRCATAFARIGRPFRSCRAEHGDKEDVENAARTKCRMRRCAALIGAVCALTASCLLIFRGKD